jgi:hypothetical protein
MLILFLYWIGRLVNRSFAGPLARGDPARTRTLSRTIHAHHGHQPDCVDVRLPYLPI